MNKKCLECGEELTSSQAIIFHSCEAYQKQETGNSWIDLLFSNSEKGKDNGN